MCICKPRSGKKRERAKGLYTASWAKLRQKKKKKHQGSQACTLAHTHTHLVFLFLGGGVRGEGYIESGVGFG